MGLSTVTFTMRNEGFRSQYVAPYSKAILVTAVLDEAKCIATLVVLGIPLPVTLPPAPSGKKAGGVPPPLPRAQEVKLGCSVGEERIVR
jgi:hypothetical protein